MTDQPKPKQYVKRVTPKAAKRKTVQARLTEQQMDRIREAAEIDNRSLSGFLVHAAVVRADEILGPESATPRRNTDDNDDEDSDSSNSIPRKAA